MYEHHRLRRQKDIAKYFGVTNQAISNWKRSDTIPSKFAIQLQVEKPTNYVELVESLSQVLISLNKNIVSELGIGKFVQPYQKPHPEIAVSLKNPNSMTAKLAGEKGWIPISGNFIDAKDIATHWPTYLEGAEKAGKKPLFDKWRVG